MGSYYPSFSYMGLNSLEDKNLIVASFDADQGEMDTFLGMEPIYTESSDGTHRLDYGAKFNSVAVIKISVIKANRKDFTVAEVRDFLKWTTGVRQNSYLDLLIGDKVQFSFLGRVTNAYQQKLDARTIGLAIEFTSSSPWAYSPQQNVHCSFGQALTVSSEGIVSKGTEAALLDVESSGVLYNGTDGGGGLFQITKNGTVYIDNSVKIQIDNQTDDLYSYITLNTKFINKNSDEVSIKNLTLDEETIITGMSDNEIITLSSGQFISSDVPNKIFGNNFNFVWPRLAPGINDFVVSGSGIGSIEFAYRYPIKIGDCAIDIDVPGGYIDCDGSLDNTDGVITCPISWDDIVDTPTTLVGYGITDAYPVSAVYNKDEIDDKISDASDEAKSAASLASSVSSNLENNYYKKANVYTKQEVNSKIASVTDHVNQNAERIDEVYNEAKSAAFLASRLSSQLTDDYYDKDYIDDNYYDKTKIDDIISQLQYESSSGINSVVTWNEIVDKPTNLSDYRVRSEVQDMINDSRNEMLMYDVYSRAEVDALISSVQISIDENELNAMLDEILV